MNVINIISSVRVKNKLLTLDPLADGTIGYRPKLVDTLYTFVDPTIRKF